MAIWNNSSKTVTLEQGSSWIQLVVVKIHAGDLERVQVVEDDTARGQGGFGSTGNTDAAKATATVAAVPREPEAASEPATAAAAAGDEEVEAGEAPVGAAGSHGE